MKYGVCNSRFFETFDRPEKIKVYCGGGGSAKSTSIAQYFIIQLCSGDGERRAIFRKTFSSMMATTYILIKDLLSDWSVPFHEDKTHHIIYVFSRDNQMYEYHGDPAKWDGEVNTLSYLGLDDPEKIKGAEFKEVWLEEVTDFNHEDYKQLRIRLSRTRDDVVMYMSYNPIASEHWVIKKVAETAATDPKIFFHHSTYKDNLKFLSQSFVDELEDLINTDENFYRIYALGLPGILKGQIYKNWDFSDPETWPKGYKNGMHFYCGDFGFNAPMAMAEIWYYDGEYYIKELLYKRGLTTLTPPNMTPEDHPSLVSFMGDHGISKTADQYWDSAEPDRILELCNSGYNAKPSNKQVKPGIDYVKGCQIHVDATCSPNIQKEYGNYKWKENAAGESLDEPVKAFDHIMDAIRYGIFTAPTEPTKAVSNVTVSRPSFGAFNSSMPKF